MRSRKTTTKASRLRVLFLCTGNSCRSQMAEGWARHLLRDRVEVHSAGTHPSVVNPRAIHVMKEAGIDLSSHRSKSLDEFLDKPFDLVITLCDHAQANCPIFPNAAKTLHMGFRDPALAVGPQEHVLKVYREVRDAIRQELMPLLERELVKRSS